MGGVREFKAASLLAFLLAASLSTHALAQDGRIAIIDSSDSVKSHVKGLADLGVAVIGRYYGRCPQWGYDKKGNKVRIVPEKRFIDNLDEIKAILDDGRFGVLSVYQFYSQEAKFDRNRPSRKPQFWDDRPRNPNPKTVRDFNDCFTPKRPNTIAEDATLDGTAAVAQAQDIIKQPVGSAIYFGVDFDLDDARRENVLTYFRIIKKIVTDAGYVVGVYGNGVISDLLLEKKLVEYVWLTASPGHAGSAETYNTRHWDLLQTKTDIGWIVAGKRAALDTNIQNPASTNVGFWKRDGAFIVPHERNVAIHTATRFVCEGRPKVVDGEGRPIKACSNSFARVVRISAVNASKNLVHVDCDENGVADGWMNSANLSTLRPKWVSEKYWDITHCKP